MYDLEELIMETHPLLFLFKSAEYASEMEIRSVVHKSGYSERDKVQLDDATPGRAFVYGGFGLVADGSIVYFGPRSDHKYAVEIMALAARCNIYIKTFVSRKPYR
jgi:hypothetical protein